MNYWGTLAASALLFPAMVAAEKMVGTVDDDVTVGADGGVIGIDVDVGGFLRNAEQDAPSGWERIEVPHDPKDPNTPIVRTSIDHPHPSARL